MDFYASEILEMLEEEGIEKAVFCGLSMGGYVLLALFRSRPDLFAGLVLCDTTAEADSPEKRDGRAAMIRKVEDQGTAFLVDELLPNLISRSTIENNEPLVRWLSEVIREQPPSAVCAALRGMAARPESRELLSRIGFPVKLVFGADDGVTGKDAVKVLKDGIPETDLVIIESAGHYSNLESKPEFNRALISYLKSLNLTH